MSLRKESPCKVNLLLNILGKRADGYHELETIIHPVNLHDRLTFATGGDGIVLRCNSPDVPTDASNLVHRAATAFFDLAKVRRGVHIDLEKNIPVAAGLGGGSGNAAMTLEGLNELFGNPLGPVELHKLAGALGSDVPFFLQPCPALATGRGEHVVSLEVFPALQGKWFLLIYPGFGISTAWSYQQLSRFPEALNGRPGRAAKLLTLLQTSDLRNAGTAFYNSLEPAALEKYPVLHLFQTFMREQGAPATMMSGSGSTTFAILNNEAQARAIQERVLEKFGPVWSAVVAV